MGIALPGAGGATRQSMASGAQVIDGSLKFVSGSSTNLNRTPSSAGNRKTFTWSGWVKRSTLSTDQRSLLTVASGTNDNDYFQLGFRQDKLVVYGYSTQFLETTQVFRDVSAWMHIVLSANTSNVTANDRLRLYVNGSEITSFSGRTNPSSSQNLGVNRIAKHQIGIQDTGYPFDGSLTNIQLIDGQQLDASYFGYTDGLTNTWRPKKYEGTFGTNGFYLPMDGNSPIGHDKSNPNPINNGSVWSSMCSGTEYSSTYSYEKAFDGSTSTVNFASNGNTITFTPTGGIVSSGNILVTFDNGSVTDGGGSADFQINGSSVKSFFQTAITAAGGGSGSSRVATITGITNITSMSWSRVADNDLFGVRKIEVGGVALVDGIYGNGWTPVNFGGSVALDNPIVSGARPILNTDGGGNVARPGVFGSEVGAYYAVTVSNPGSGNKYYLDGVLTPTPTFYRGSTYTFDYTAATSHPLYLSALSDGKHNSKAYSVQFDGTGDYLTLAQSNDFDLTGDYTYEAFIYYTDTTNNPTIFDFSAASGNYEGRLQIQAGTLYLYNAGWVSKGAISANTWHHIAVTQDFIFVDGINIGSGTGAISGSNYKVVTIGARTNNGGTSYGDYFTGYISNARIVNGTALYTENFTVPTTTLTNVTNTKLLCCQDNNATTAVVAPGGITAVGNAAASNTYNPFVYNIDNYFGVDASTSNVTKQVIPHSAVDTLYYFCNIHSGMGGSANIVTDETKADPYAWKNVLALPLIGSANDVSNSVNSGSTTKAITTQGNAAASSAESNFYGGSFVFDGTGDYLTTPDSADFDLAGNDFTIEAFVYHSSTNFGSYESVIGQWSDSSTGSFVFETVGAGASSDLEFYYVDTSNNFVGPIQGAALQKERWQHVAVCRGGSTIRVFIDGIMYGTGTSISVNIRNSSDPVTMGGQVAGSGGYWNGYIQDIRILNGIAKYTSNFIPASTNPDILPDTPSGVSGSSKLAKVTDGAVHFDGTGDYLSIADSSDLTVGTNPFTLEFYAYKTAAGEDFFCGSYDSSGTTASLSYAIQTGGSSPTNSLVAHVAEGGSATSVNSGVDFVLNKWVHVAFVRDGNTLRLFQDGIQMSTAAFSGTVNDASNAFEIGRAGFSGKDFPGFISNFRFVNGTALYTSNFTPPTRELTNVTNTKLLCCQSPTSATEGAVKPGTITANGGAAATNFNPFNTDINTVRGQESGYATLNPVANFGGVVLSDGNLQVDEGSSGESHNVTSTFGMASGKFYCEYKHTYASTGNGLIGISPGPYCQGVYPGSSGGSDDNTTNAYGFYTYNRGVLHANSYNMNGVASNVHSRVPQGSTIGIALDMDNYKCWWSVDGVWQPYPSSGVTDPNPATGNHPHAEGFNSDSDTWHFVWGKAGAETGVFNFGQKPFKFPPPDGFQPLNGANTKPVKVFARPDQYVGVTTYTGNGGTQALTMDNNSMSPDFVWIKARTLAASHMLMDSVRGADKIVTSNGTSAQSSAGADFQALYGNLDSFDSNGFTVASGSDANGNFNSSSKPYVAWSWKAGGNKNTFNKDDVGYASAAAAGLDAGTVNPNKVSVGTKNGFSIIELTTPSSGTTYSFAHGLGAKPSFLMARQYETTGNWYVWHQSLPANNSYVLLNNTNAVNSSSTVWASTDMTSTLISDTASGHWGTSEKMLYYAWTDIPGLQKFGSYEGNGDADGPFIELGFRPAVVLTKNADAVDDWSISDSSRSPYNVAGESLRPNSDSAEDSSADIDILSNGFKIRQGNSHRINYDGETFIYAAWAEAPTFNLYGAQSNAR